MTGCDPGLGKEINLPFLKLDLPDILSKQQDK